MNRYSREYIHDEVDNHRQVAQWWIEADEVDTRIQELGDENKLLKNKDALAQVCIDIKTDNDILRKALEVLERTVAQIWDCKYEADKIHIIINRVFGTPDNLLKKYKNDLYGISKEDLQIAAEALKEMSDG